MSKSVQDAQEVKTPAAANVPVAQGVKRKRAVVSLLWHLRRLLNSVSNESMH